MSFNADGEQWIRYGICIECEATILCEDDKDRYGSWFVEYDDGSRNYVCGEYTIYSFSGPDMEAYPHEPRVSPQELREAIASIERITEAQGGPR